MICLFMYVYVGVDMQAFGYLFLFMPHFVKKTFKEAYQNKYNDRK